MGYGVAFLVLLRGLDAGGEERFGFNMLLACLLGTWASDIFAYFGGRLLGRRRLAPAISPNKTVEGFVIGLVFGTATAWFTLYDQGGLSPVEVLAIAFAIALAGPIGDLFESFVKRDLGVKDSGTLLAGHGGVLDRIDALLFAGPAALAIVALLGRRNVSQTQLAYPPGEAGHRTPRQHRIDRAAGDPGRWTTIPVFASARSPRAATSTACCVRPSGSACARSRWPIPAPRRRPVRASGGRCSPAPPARPAGR